MMTQTYSKTQKYNKEEIAGLQRDSNTSHRRNNAEYRGIDIEEMIAFNHSKK